MGTHSMAAVADLARRAYAALQQDHLALAEDLLLRLIAVAPDDPAYAERLAMLYQRRGKHGLAIAFAQRAAALDPEDLHLARLLGSALEAGGEPDLARAAYLAAVAAGNNPRHPLAWLALARLERTQGQLATAEHYARRAVDAAPHAPEAYLELARVLLQAAHPDNALTVLAIGLRLAPDDVAMLALRDAALAAVPSTSEVHADEEGAVPFKPP